MKIAFCYSGQPRTWANCAPGHFKLIEQLNKKFNATTDIFCHAWDFNTKPHAVLKSKINTSVDDYLTVKGTPLSEDEKEQFLSVFEPETFIFEDEEKSKSRILQIRNWGQELKEKHGGAVIEWASSQLYGIMHSAHLKKKHEYENNIKYDMCFRMRYDLYFDDHQIDWFLSDRNTDINIPKYNTLYSCHTSLSPTPPFRRAGDIFWYSDSVTFDRICDVYRWLPQFGIRPFGTTDVGVSPEHVLYYYAKMLRMQIHALTVDPKIYRQSDYLINKVEAGQPAELGGHELM